jgi:hypothetical protein
MVSKRCSRTWLENGTDENPTCHRLLQHIEVRLWVERSSVQGRVVDCLFELRVLLGVSRVCLVGAVLTRSGPDSIPNNTHCCSLLLSGLPLQRWLSHVLHFKCDCCNNYHHRRHRHNSYNCDCCCGGYCSQCGVSRVCQNTTDPAKTKNDTLWYVSYCLVHWKLNWILSSTTLAYHYQNKTKNNHYDYKQILSLDQDS